MCPQRRVGVQYQKAFTVFFQRLSLGKMDGSTLIAEKGRCIVMLGQSIIHAANDSQVKTPKHIGLAVTINNLTGSKVIVTL